MNNYAVVVRVENPRMYDYDHKQVTIIAESASDAINKAVDEIGLEVFSIKKQR